uniref:Uncharacterized protein n=1 Tax=Heterorhabditis bacteriophora TaxID=37862 RepID=A0A1I7WSD1_HETBA
MSRHIVFDAISQLRFQCSSVYSSSLASAYPCPLIKLTTDDFEKEYWKT